MNFKKSILALALVGMLFGACKQNASAPAAEAPAANTTATAKAADAPLIGKAETASFHIEGMSCAVMCASKIEKELSAMEGVKKAKVDFEKKTATVEYDNAVQTPQKLAAKVESVADGKTYKVSDIKSSADHAMLYGQQEKQPKKKAAKKAKKEEKEAKSESKEGKPGCCAGKKHCSEGGKM